MVFGGNREGLGAKKLVGGGGGKLYNISLLQIFKLQPLLLLEHENNKTSKQGSKNHFSHLSFFWLFFDFVTLMDLN